MKVPIWIHNVSSAYPGTGGLPVDDTLNPFSVIYGKTNDGLRFQAQWDGHRLSIGSVGDVGRADRDIYGGQGIGFVPWGVVHGRWEDQIDYCEREGALAAAIAVEAAGDGETPVYIVDLEPYYHAPFPAFWRSDLGADEGTVSAFVGAFRQGAPDGELWLAVDAREPHLEPVSFSAWAREGTVVKRILPMVYFTDFVRPREPNNADVSAAITEMFDLLGDHGVSASAIAPIFPGDASPTTMTHAIERSVDHGFGGVSVWQRGNLRRDTAERIAAMDDRWGTTSAGAAPLDRAGIAAKLDEIEMLVTKTEAGLAATRSVIQTSISEIEETLSDINLVQLGREQAKMVALRAAVADIRSGIREE